VKNVCIHAFLLASGRDVGSLGQAFSVVLVLSRFLERAEPWKKKAGAGLQPVPRNGSDARPRSSVRQGSRDWEGSNINKTVERGERAKSQIQARATAVCRKKLGSRA
jgi:hypothetical protein